MAEQVTVKCRPGDGGAITGPLWVFGWLFTIGYLHLPFAKGLFALVIWPYYLGAFLRKG
jgi:hypothetical protein